MYLTVGQGLDYLLKVDTYPLKRTEKQAGRSERFSDLEFCEVVSAAVGTYLGKN